MVFVVILNGLVTCLLVRRDAGQGDRSRDAAARLTDLLTRASRGDEAAFADFYDATSARAYGLALRVVRNPTHAEAVTQEAYLDAWRSSTRFDPALGSAAGWLLTIVHRKAAAT